MATSIADRCFAEVSLDILADNYRILKKKAGPKAEVMAVVKANAYGHGSVKVAGMLESIGAKHFGVASLDEAINLRNAGIGGEILVFGPIRSEDFLLALDNDITPTVSSFRQARSYSLLAGEKDFNVHVNLDTGMSRMGLPCRIDSEAKEALNTTLDISGLPNCVIRGIYTHFAVAEDDEKFTRRQFSLFKEVTDGLKEKGLDIPLKHCCNSAATILYDEMHLDMVRCGIALYGLPPVGTDLELRPALALKARIVRLEKLEKGMSVSYGRHFKAEKEMEVGTLAIGYADGLPRILSGNASVLYKGRKCPVLGTICMDLTMFDATGCDAKEGDEVELFGSIVTASDIGKSIKTISYEILTNLSERVERIYI